MGLGGRGNREQASGSKFSVNLLEAPTNTQLSVLFSVPKTHVSPDTPLYTRVYCTLFPCPVSLRSREGPWSAERQQSPRTQEPDYTVYPLPYLQPNNPAGQLFSLHLGSSATHFSCLCVSTYMSPEAVQHAFVILFTSPLLGYAGNPSTRASRSGTEHKAHKDHFMSSGCRGGRWG